MEFRKPKKNLGQNFLVNKGVIRDFVEAAKIDSKDVVLEIGPGKGAITRELAKVAHKVYAIEYDSDLIPILKSNLGKVNNVEIINEDILKLQTSNFKKRAGRADALPARSSALVDETSLSANKLPSS